MTDVLSILNIRRTALNRAFELIKADQDLNKYPSRAVIVLEGEIAGLDFALNALAAASDNAAVLLRDLCRTLIDFADATLGSDESNALIQRYGADIESVSADDLPFVGLRLAKIVWPDQVVDEPMPRPDPGDGTFVDRLNQDPERLSATVAFAMENNIPGFEPAGETPAAPASSNPSPQELEVAAPAAPSRETETKRNRPANQKERVLEVYERGHHRADDIALITGIGKASVAAVLSTLRKEGAIPCVEKEEVLAAYLGGHTTLEEIVAHTGLGLPTARQYLHVLRREGKIAPEPEAALPELEIATSEPETQAKQPEPFVGPKARVAQAWYDGLRTSKEIAEKTGIREETVIYTLGILRNEGKIRSEPTGRSAHAEAGKP